jgi:hypothetical protein
VSGGCRTPQDPQSKTSLASAERDARARPFVLLGICMAPAILSLLTFLALTGWRFVFTGLWHRRLVREIEAPQQRRNGFLELRLDIFDRADVEILAGYLENGSDGLDPINRNDRARSYLRRIVGLTAATQIGNSYFLDVGKTQFFVRAGYVRRLRDATDPQCVYEETCFYSAHKELPKAEQIATALLQLKNNPALFDGWVAHNGLAFKADGQVFTHTQ